MRKSVSLPHVGERGLKSENKKQKAKSKETENKNKKQKTERKSSRPHRRGIREYAKQNGRKKIS